MTFQKRKWVTPVKSHYRPAIFFLILAAAVASPLLAHAQTAAATPTQAELISKVDKLAQELEDVRAQLAALKKNGPERATSDAGVTSSFAPAVTTPTPAVAAAIVAPASGGPFAG